MAVRVREERPPSLLDPKPVGAATIFIGLFVAVGAHIVIPGFLIASQWLLVMMGLALPTRPPPPAPDNVIAAEFVKLGKPFDPTKLPNRKVPPIAKRTPDGVVVSKDAQEHEKKPEEKEKPKDSQAALLDNLVDRTKDFAEDVQVEEEGDPNGIREGTATEAKAGDIYRGQLMIFFRRNWTVPNVVQNVDSKVVTVGVQVADDGAIKHVGVSKSSGDPLFDQSAIDAVQALIDANATLPEPPVDQRASFYGVTLGIQFDGKNAR